MRLPPPRDNSESDEGLAQALLVAHGSFFKGLSFVERATHGSTGVSVDPGTQELVLSINPQTPLAADLLPSLGNWRDAWILILAHESGHLRLNSICQASGDDPDDPDMQLKAMGLETVRSGSAIADFQKETAIEAFCDACAGKAAVDLLGADWRQAVEALRDYRSTTSKKMKVFSGDEYATSPALNELLRRDGKVEPSEAAQVAYEEILRRTSSLKKLAVAIATRIPELKHNLSSLIKQRRNAVGQGPPPPSDPSI